VPKRERSTGKAKESKEKQRRRDKLLSSNGEPLSCATPRGRPWRTTHHTGTVVLLIKTTEEVTKPSVQGLFLLKQATWRTYSEFEWEARGQKIFSKKLYFRFCRSFRLCHTYSTLLLSLRGSQTQSINKSVDANKTLFTSTGNWPAPAFAP
jgi:hypothetical protein